MHHKFAHTTESAAINKKYIEVFTYLQEVVFLSILKCGWTNLGYSYMANGSLL